MTQSVDKRCYCWLTNSLACDYLLPTTDGRCVYIGRLGGVCVLLCKAGNDSRVPLTLTVVLVHLHCYI